MTITPSYPGVYVQEIPSGVRTITGVATSIAAFIGGAKRGPINRAVRVLGYADYERRFGGLSHESAMSYAVRQFFNNGGGEAWIVRVAKNATTAELMLDSNANQLLKITALNAGKDGNDIKVFVDYSTANPASTFNLTLVYSNPNDPSAGAVETFDNLSMNSKDPRFVETVVNGRSELVKVERKKSTPALGGKSVSGEITDTTKVDATHDRFRISVDGGAPVDVVIDTSTLPINDVASLKSKITAPAGVTITNTATTLTFTSNTVKDFSSIHILPGLTKDASGVLKLGLANGGTETDAAAELRPAAAPLGGKVVGKDIANADFAGLPKVANTSFQISLDGGPKRTVTLPGPVSTDAASVAKAIQDEVRKLDFSPAYKNFTAAAALKQGDNTKSILTLTSGTKGTGSGVALTAGDDLLKTIGLDAVTSTAGADLPLTGGNEDPFDITAPQSAIIGSQAKREGLYALDAVDLFNILCLPGVTDAGTLADVTKYCEDRRAFFIVDPPADRDKPDEMEAYVAGTSLPKSSYAAVYYPWIRIADPLNDGALYSVPPSGTVAGVYARTDATRGVWKAPAGTEANLNGVLGADYVLTDRENGILNPRGVNCIRIMPTFGAVAWGARTLRGDNAFADEWKYIPVRRIALFIEESLYRGTQWVVFEPNDEPLWAQIRLNIGAFMQNLFRQGAFQGRSPREAYLVKCDRETTTQNDINLGVVNILVGFAPLKPAEFVFIRIQQLAGQIQA
jgi:uncharacterized protein